MTGDEIRQKAREYRKQWSHKPTAIPSGATGLWYSEECTDALMAAFAESILSREADSGTPADATLANLAYTDMPADEFAALCWNQAWNHGWTGTADLRVELDRRLGIAEQSCIYPAVIPDQCRESGAGAAPPAAFGRQPEIQLERLAWARSICSQCANGIRPLVRHEGGWMHQVSGQSGYFKCSAAHVWDRAEHKFPADLLKMADEIRARERAASSSGTPHTWANTCPSCGIGKLIQCRGFHGDSEADDQLWIRCEGCKKVWYMQPESSGTPATPSALEEELRELRLKVAAFSPNQDEKSQMMLDLAEENESLIRDMSLAVEHEREACAKLVESLPRSNEGPTSFAIATYRIAKAIRSRASQPAPDWVPHYPRLDEIIEEFQRLTRERKEQEKQDAGLRSREGSQVLAEDGSDSGTIGGRLDNDVRVPDMAGEVSRKELAGRIAKRIYDWHFEPDMNFDSEPAQKWRKELTEIIEQELTR